ncbi:MAG: ABC transporter ATP-binding protein, partial [Actinomycetia bacterium]|nr:ABC transporter ATP-binding protein [Actinomycetes bacterium]
LFRPSRLLILDEPEQRLDTSKRALLADLLRERTDDGGTIIMASHDPTLTEAVADQVIDLLPAEND